MKKITKLLSVLLAIAVIICPMMSAVVVNAEDPANGYSLTKDGDVATLTITSTTGFMVYQASVAFEGGSIDTKYSEGGYVNGVKVDDYAVIVGSKDANNLPRATANLKDGVLTFIVVSTDAACDDLYSSVKVLLKLDSDKVKPTLTKIQAADDGTSAGIEADAKLLDFSGAGVSDDGTVNEDTDYAKEHATPHDWQWTSNGNGTHTVTCTGCDYNEIEACDKAGTDGACSKCGYNASTVCTHEHLTFVSATPATETASGSLSYKCADCDAEFNNVPVTYNKYSRASSSGLNADSETLLRFNIRVDKDLKRVGDGTIENGIVVFDANDEAILTDKGVDTDQFTTTITDEGPQIDATYGVAAMCYTVGISATVYSYDESTDTWYNGTTLEKTIKAVAETILGTASNSLQKTMLVDLLYYGADAQTAFDRYTETLATDGISGNTGYTSLRTVITGTDLSKEGSNMPAPTDDAPTWFCYMFGANAESMVQIRPYIRMPKQYTGASIPFDMTGYKVVATYTSVLGDDKTITVNSSEFYGTEDGKLNRYMLYIPVITPDLRTTVTIQVYNGDTPAGPACQQSMENCLAGMYATAKPEYQAMYCSLMAFSDAVQSYLTTK